MVGAIVGLVTLLLTNLLSVHPRSEEIKRLQAEKDALKIDLSRSLMFCQLLKSMNELDDETLDKKEEEINKLRQQNDALHQEIQEQLDNQTEGSDGKA